MFCRGICLSTIVCLVLALSTNADELDTSRGDKMIARYFELQTKQIADDCFGGVKTLEDWKKLRPKLRKQFLEML